MVCPILLTNSQKLLTAFLSAILHNNIYVTSVQNLSVFIHL
ncbi:cell wall-binding repeat-containing protein [Lactococcus lactis]|nr:cell wall-binding repeat-containing protein [Lactococcus lactis]